MNRKNTAKMDKLFISTLISLTGFSAPIFAQTVQRPSSLPQHMMNKVVKRKFQKPVQKSKVKKNKSQLSFDLNILNSEYASWGVEPANTSSSINLVPAWKTFKKKKEIVVAVIDTGIDPNHPFLRNNLYVKNGTASSVNYGVDFSKNRADARKPFDNHGHGTHVSGIIKSVYPEVKILPLKYYNPKASGQDNLESTIAALKYAVDQNVDVINYSGGGPEPALEELKILKEAERKGILVVAAAGNEESNIDIRSNAYYPASYGLKNIITVTAHNKQLQMLNSSNWGKKSVDISAPGYRIRSSLPKGRAGYLTGTSQATAFVSGAAALIMSQYPELSTEEVKEVIKRSAKQEVTLMSKCSSGGRLDAGHAQQFAAEYLKAKSTRGLATKKGVAMAKRRKASRRVAMASKKHRKSVTPGKIIFRKRTTKRTK